MLRRTVGLALIALALALVPTASADAAKLPRWVAGAKVTKDCSTWEDPGRCRVRRHQLVTIEPHLRWLRLIGDCENASFGTWRLRSGLDAYNPSPFFGRYQFTMSTWYSVGGRGDPRSRGWLRQAYRAVLVMRSQGFGAWPVCRHRAGV